MNPDLSYNNFAPMDLGAARSRHQIDELRGRTTNLSPAVEASAPLRPFSASSQREEAVSTLRPEGDSEYVTPPPAQAAPVPEALEPPVTNHTEAPLLSAASAPDQLSRDLQPWDQIRVDALIEAGTIEASWLPDIRAVVPEKLLIQREHKRDMLRFSNSIANTGPGNWQVRRGIALSAETDPELTAYAISLGLDISELAVTSQELLHPDGSIAAVIHDAALSEYHPEHKHFHIGETAEFSIEHHNTLTGQWDSITGLDIVKTTFCLIDVNQIQSTGSSDPNEYTIIKSPAKANVYNDCFADVQGIQSGWIDRYSHSLQGQEVDVTSLAAGTYRLKVTVNPSNWFLESDYSNNISTIGFELHRNKQGQAFLTELPGLSSGIWFAQSPNGMG